MNLFTQTISLYTRTLWHYTHGMLGFQYASYKGMMLNWLAILDPFETSLVNESAFICALGTCSSLIVLASTCSRKKWWRTSMCFVLLWYTALVARSYAPQLSMLMVLGWCESCGCNSAWIFRHQSASWQAVIYSASVLDNATVVCLLVAHKIGPFWK